MRRLLRILLNAAMVLSLVLCAATMAAWVRSYQAHDTIWWSGATPPVLAIDTHLGGLFAGVITPLLMDLYPPPGVGREQSVPVDYDEAVRPDTLFNRLGFALDYSQNSRYATRQLACPYWFIMLLTAILPAARLAGWRRRARRLRLRPGLCQHCGYDCRATPDRCPECGRATTNKASR